MPVQMISRPDRILLSVPDMFSPESPNDAVYPSVPDRKPGSPYQFKKTDPHSSHSVILSLFPKAGSGAVLDVGAAHGYIAAALRQRGFSVSGIELDPVLAREAAHHCNQLFIVDLEESVPHFDTQFDFIVYGDVLEHLKNPLDVLLRLNQQLRPDGIAIISLPNIANIYMRLQLLLGRFDYADRGILDRTHLRFFTRKSLDALLDAAGLDVVRMMATPIPLPMVVAQRFHGNFFSMVHNLNAWVASSWQAMFAYQFIAVARKRAFI